MKELLTFSPTLLNAIHKPLTKAIYSDLMRASTNFKSSIKASVEENLKSRIEYLARQDITLSETVISLDGEFNRMFCEVSLYFKIEGIDPVKNDRDFERILDAQKMVWETLDRDWEYPEALDSYSKYKDWITVCKTFEL